MIAELERLAAEMDASMTPIDYVCERTAQGVTLRQIARDIGPNIGHPDFGPGTLSSWVNTTENGKQKIAAARALAADSLVEEAGEILDDLAGTEMTREEVALAKTRADHRTWLASKWNRPVYGADQAQVNVALNLPGLHLEALRLRAQSVPLLPLAGPDVEVVSD